MKKQNTIKGKKGAPKKNALNKKSSFRSSKDGKPTATTGSISKMTNNDYEE